MSCLNMEPGYPVSAVTRLQAGWLTSHD